MAKLSAEDKKRYQRYLREHDEELIRADEAEQRGDDYVAEYHRKGARHWMFMADTLLEASKRSANPVGAMNWNRFYG